MERIGKYELLRKIGEGATATVWLARDPFAQRDVAIKAIAASAFADGEHGQVARKLFITEASLAGKLIHPHIVHIHDAVLGSGGEPSYIVMEYVPGGTLEPFTAPENLLPLPDVVEIVFKCSRALEFARRMGVIHRDLKPANVLRAFDPGGEGTDVKVSDFGAALSVSSDQTQVSGIGSPAYMSPQQVMEQPLNHQSDIFLLGVVLHQLLTGQLPFRGDSGYDIAHQICNVEPPLPSSLRPGLPTSLNAIVARALKKSVRERYPTWDEFSFDLAEVFRNENMAAMREARIGEAEKFNLLRTLSFFRDFSDVEIWEVLRLSRWQRVRHGDVLMREGDRSQDFCVLAAGEVKVTKQGKLLNVLAAGECFGEMAYLTPERGARTANVTAMGDGLVITVATESLARASQAARHGFDRAFLRILVERLDLANTRLTSAAL
ncbi:MAG: serine/threonine-protein kinase [Candidatus Nitricoxidivorans perseverans]|uniref:Serine/threonine-protein kinase n=1 Tax=Candidatus Nitricoxidivorans perseverans TaxID=2975601 RepID=A0AA49FML8_9PROT|nr:MAG: serine/threonine-protein kinase [Candidatus Nitricoxidivorans perseverans]